jgi:hypothetical protein
MENTTTYKSKTQVANLAAKAGLRVSRLIKGKVTSYSSRGVRIRAPYYAEICLLADSAGWLNISWQGSWDGTASDLEQRALLAKFLTDNGFEQNPEQANLYRKTR